MQPSSSSSSSSVTEFQQLWGSWTNQLNRFYDDPKMAQLMSTKIGLYFGSHPVQALAVLLFSAMAALPVGLFLIFALVTIIMSAVGFVFFEVFLLFVAGLTLLSVLFGIALFSVVASLIFHAFYIIISNMLNTRLTKGRKSECETSELKDKQ